MKLQVLGCLLAFVAVVSGQEVDGPHPRFRCRAPQAFESQFNLIAPKFNTYVPIAKLTYDGENRRTRTVEVVYANSTKTTYDVLYYQPCKTMFVYNVEKKKCKRVKADYPWRPVSVPDDAKYLGDAYLGSPGIRGGGLLVQSWMGKGQDPKYPFDYAVTYTRHGCLPLSFTAWGKKIGLMQSSYFNVVVGIENPNVFIPPKACYDQGEVMMEDLVHINQPIRTANLRQPRPQESLYEILRNRQREEVRSENDVL